MGKLPGYFHTDPRGYTRAVVETLVAQGKSGIEFFDLELIERCAQRAGLGQRHLAGKRKILFDALARSPLFTVTQKTYRVPSPDFGVDREVVARAFTLKPSAHPRPASK